MPANIAITRPATREAVRDPWLGVEPRHLSALAAVAREGSFCAAADSLGYVQSAVSQQLAQLERVVQCRLVERERGSTRIALTPAGELLLSHAERLLADLGAAHADLDGLALGQAGRLRVGASSAVGAAVLARVVPGLRREVPKLRVEAIEAPAAELASQVASGTLDVAFAELPLPDGRFVSTKLCSYDHVLLAPPPSGRGRPDGPVSAEELSTLPLLDHPLMETVEPLLHNAGVSPHYELWCESLLAVRRLVAAGVGYAIVPSLLVEGPDDAAIALPLDPPLPARSVCVFRHSERIDAPAATLLCDHAARVYDPLGPFSPWAPLRAA